MLQRKMLLKSFVIVLYKFYLYVILITEYITEANVLVKETFIQKYLLKKRLISFLTEIWSVRSWLLITLIITVELFRKQLPLQNILRSKCQYQRSSNTPNI